MKKIIYSKSLTSLRGISVLVVLLYHSKYSLFKGGFLGVDIFFVISGYLIGNIIFTDLNENNFSFIRFYLRRIRRLFPALLSTVIFTYFLNYFLLLLEDFTSLKESLIYYLIYRKHIFWQNNDYFSLETEILPLSHLWSLVFRNNFIYYFQFLYFFFINFTLEQN